MIAAALVVALAVVAPPTADPAEPTEPTETPETPETPADDGPQIRGGTGNDPEAQRIRTVAQDAAALVERDEHDAALDRIDEAERERLSPALVFMRGAVEEDRGRCEQAIAHYREFLAMDVPAEDAAAAHAGLRRCGVEPPRTEPPPADAANAKSSDDPKPDLSRPADTDLPPRKRWYADPAGGVLAAVGIASLAVGGTLWGLAAREAERAREQDRLSEFDSRARRAERMQPAGIAMVAIGGALVIAAAVRYGIVARRERGRTSATARTRPIGTAAGGVYIRF